MIASFLWAALAPILAPDVTWTAPTLFAEGLPFPVHVEIVSAEPVPAWMLDASLFTIDGQPLAERKKRDDVKLEGGKRALDLDLGPAIRGHKAFKKRGFQLDLVGGATPREVRVGEIVSKSTKFLDEKAIPTAELVSFHAILCTNRGNLEVELWPDAAKNHVRNFLDLCHAGFYDGTAFHRVSPGFMIQGGDPNTKTDAKGTWGTGGGPRMMKHEFSAKKHVRGVLSMARGDDPDSGSCQFFVMHATSPALDGQYSAFGMLVDGFDALDRIVETPGTAYPDGTIQPTEPQRIVRAAVVKVAGQKPADDKKSKSEPK